MGGIIIVLEEWSGNKEHFCPCFVLFSRCSQPIAFFELVKTRDPGMYTLMAESPNASVHAFLNQSLRKFRLRFLPDLFHSYAWHQIN